MQKFLTEIFLIVGACYGGIVLLIYFTQRNYIYFPTAQDFARCEGFRESSQLDFEGTRAYFTDISDKLIVFYHGNAGSACDRAFLKDEFTALGYSSLVVEYAGYSNDAREPSQPLLMQDIAHVQDFLKTRNFREVILMGESIGAALASYHSSLFPATKIVLIAPFDSLVSVGKHHYGFLPVAALLKDTYPAFLWINTNPTATLVIHGEKDTIMPRKISERFFSAAKSPKKTFISVPGAGHNDIYAFPTTWDAIRHFLES